MNKSEYEISDEEMKYLVMELNQVLENSDSSEDFCNDGINIYDELKMACWNVLHENPGSECQDWIDILISQYPAEVCDVFGGDPEDVFAGLADWWDCQDFEDDDTGICERFRDWAEYFVNERSVELYDMLVDARRKIKRANAILKP